MGFRRMRTVMRAMIADFSMPEEKREAEAQWAWACYQNAAERGILALRGGVANEFKYRFSAKKYRVFRTLGTEHAGTL